MSVRRKQKVVLREKVRRLRWNIFKTIFFQGFKFIVFFSILVFVAVLSYRFLRHSDFFMLKSIEIEPSDSQIAPQIARELSGLKNLSIFGFSMKHVKQNLRKKIPVIHLLKIRRSLPDRLKVRYDIRTPLALLDNGKLAIDEDGVVFPMKCLKNTAYQMVSSSVSLPTDWPELTFASLEKTKLKSESPQYIHKDFSEESALSSPLTSALHFIKMWSLTKKDDPLWLSTSSLHKVSVDESGEITLFVDDQQTATDTIRIVWGNFSSETFSEKFQRLQDVRSDLQKKSLKVQYVNLREMPQKNVPVLAGRRIIGRVIVRPVDRVVNQNAFHNNETRKTSLSGKEKHTISMDSNKN